MEIQNQGLTRLVNAETMREMDYQAIEKLGIPGAVLMENAARSVADWLEDNKLRHDPEASVVVCCGKGNNGGDGFAIARLLANRGYDVIVVDAGPGKEGDARNNQLIWEHFGETESFPGGFATRLIEEADVLIDAIFGIGMEKPIEGAYREWIEIFNSNEDALKIAVDVPSGISTDDSRILNIAAQCDVTISFQFGKIGCFQQPGSMYSGEVYIADISIPEFSPESVSVEADKAHEVPAEQLDSDTWLLTEEFINSILPSRNEDTHKGTFGHLLTICGSAGMGGAAMLSSMGGLKNGAGLVTCCVPGDLLDRLPGNTPEIMTTSPANCMGFFAEDHTQFVVEKADICNAIVLGCGLGRHSRTSEFVSNLVMQLEAPLLIDADGINNLNDTTIKERLGPTIMTPHPKELSRLCSCSVTEIQERRVETVRRLAKEWNVVLLLKGSYSVIGSPEGNVYINPTGTSALATAGSGDVLSGFIGGFLAQGLTPLNATLAGTFLHGLAAECIVEASGVNTLVASDLFEGLKSAKKSLQPD